MSAPAYMPLFWGDYLGGTASLDCEQHGAYLLLLGRMWQADGTLPNDPAILARIVGLSKARWAKISPPVMALMTVVDGRITQKRLAAELKIIAEKYERRAQAGSLGGRAKSLKDNKSAISNATDLLEHCSSNQNQNQNQEEKPPLSPKGEKKARRRSVPIPDDFPDMEALRIARDIVAEAGVAVHVRTEAQKIRDWALAKGELKADWLAAWRGWIRRACEGKPKLGLVISQDQSEQHDPWPSRVRAWVKDEGWNDVDWGPEPFEPGCRVPAHHLPARAAQ